MDEVEERATYEFRFRIPEGFHKRGVHLQERGGSDVGHADHVQGHVENGPEPFLGPLAVGDVEGHAVPDGRAVRGPHRGGARLHPFFGSVVEDQSMFVEKGGKRLRGFFGGIPQTLAVFGMQPGKDRIRVGQNLFGGMAEKLPRPFSHETEPVRPVDGFFHLVDQPGQVFGDGPRLLGVFAGGFSPIRSLQFRHSTAEGFQFRPKCFPAAVVDGHGNPLLGNDSDGRKGDSASKMSGRDRARFMGENEKNPVHKIGSSRFPRKRFPETEIEMV